MVLTVGSCAIAAREPCQAGNRAAISGYRYVPQGCLTRANCMISAYEIASISGCTAKLNLQPSFVKGGFSQIKGNVKKRFNASTP